MAKQIDGKKISAEVREQVKKEVDALKAKGITPCLAVIQIGDDAASSVYVNSKQAACTKVGIESRNFVLPSATTQTELVELIERLNADAQVNGILLQLPVPAHINADEVINAIAPGKDVDGTSIRNAGALYIGAPGFVACTPAGVIELLHRNGVEMEGKECAVLGCSNIVGKPMAMLLMRENATVTICHSKTRNLEQITRRADIVVVAIGRKRFIDARYIKPGAIVIDIGMHRDEQGNLCGDVDYASVEPVAGAITPVPGGVGPMTTAMLLSNCIQAAKLQNNL